MSKREKEVVDIFGKKSFLKLEFLTKIFTFENCYIKKDICNANGVLEFYVYEKGWVSASFKFSFNKVFNDSLETRKLYEINGGPNGTGSHTYRLC
tara:strand:+ start:659 stop:943 length:285 start_codon:yes stop_codon:yes gene_type:complete